MWNPFKIAMVGGSPSDQTTKHGDTFDTPTAPPQGDEYKSNYPDMLEHYGTETSVESWPSDQVPEYARDYHLQYLGGASGGAGVTGPVASYGSDVQRDTDSIQTGQPGHNWTSVTEGPVTGGASERWTWQSIRPGAVYPGYYGPVSGFGVSGDTSQMVARSYFQQEAAMYAQQAAEAALLAVQ